MAYAARVMAVRTQQGEIFEASLMGRQDGVVTVQRTDAPTLSDMNQQAAQLGPSARHFSVLLSPLHAAPASPTGSPRAPALPGHAVQANAPEAGPASPVRPLFCVPLVVRCPGPSSVTQWRLCGESLEHPRQDFAGGAPGRAIARPFGEPVPRNSGS